MPLLSKKKRLYKNQLRESNGRFGKSKRLKENVDIEENFEVEEAFGAEEDLVVGEWGDEEDSGWEEDNLENEVWVNEGNLVWKDNAILEKQKRGPYLVGPTKKSTYYDKWGPNGIYTIAASNTKNITEYFSLTKNSSYNTSFPDTVDEILEDLKDEDEGDGWEFENVLQKIKTLKNELEKSHKKMSVIEYNKKKAIFEYLQRLDKNGKGKMDASMEAARIVFIDAGSYKATIIRKWAAHWLKTGHLPPVYHGKHQKTTRLIDDEDVANRCKTWIRSQVGGVTPKTFQNFVENTLFIEIGITKKKSISLMTATRWLNILGFFYQQHHQGVYYDGHEREDVIAYREEFLKTISYYETFMAKYNGNDMNRIPPQLKDGEKEHILVTHDECIFYANDGKRGIWAPNGELPLRKKGNGRSIMI